MSYHRITQQCGSVRGTKSLLPTRGLTCISRSARISRSALQRLYCERFVYTVQVFEMPILTQLLWQCLKLSFSYISLVFEKTFPANL